ncbi:MAG: histidine phosphatase family protein [Oscillospiraceae bacterium]|jgi:broad specificity phosphatase PhoE|nr:histidine phosphatase family protein [Oscillospiraceae bacterium]
MRVCIVRHGETDWNREGRWQGREDIPLNETGREQARAVARWLTANGSWDTVISSPLSRARETAAIIADELGLSVRTYAPLVEIDYGKCAGLTSDEREKRYPTGNFRDDWEPYESVRHRAEQCIHMLGNLPEAENAIVVCHGGLIRRLLAVTDPTWMGKKFRLVNTSITILHYDAGRWTVELFNHAAQEELINI